MGNAVNIPFKQKLEERKKQAEKERKIYQACLVWNIVKEERKKKDEIEKKEKTWKKQEIERMNQDKELMDRYIKNVERERKAEQKALKKRDEEIEKKKRDSAVKIERKMQEIDDNIKREAKVMSRNIEDIEKRSLKSRDDMKTRVRAIASRQEDDRKKFIHRQENIDQERQKDIEVTKKRIRMIEKRIVQERVLWQEKLMAARRINSSNRVSAKKLWSIGRKTVEKAKQAVDKKKEQDKKIFNPQTNFEMKWKRKISENSDVEGIRMKQFKVSTIKKKLSTVNEDEPVLLGIAKKKINSRTSKSIQHIHTANGNDVSFQQKTTPIIRKSKQHRFLHLYDAKNPRSTDSEKTTKHSTIRSKMSTNDSDSDASSRLEHQKTKQRNGSVANGLEIKTNRRQSINSTFRTIKPTLTDTVNSTPRTIRPTLTDTVNSTPRTIGPTFTEQKSQIKTGISNIIVKTQSQLKKDNEFKGRTQQKPQKEVKKVAIQREQKQEIINGQWKNLESRKGGMMSDPVLSSKQTFRPEVEKMIGITPLKYSFDTNLSKELKFEGTKTSKHKAHHDLKTEVNNTIIDPKTNGINSRKDKNTGRKHEYKFEFSTAKNTTTDRLNDEKESKSKTIPDLSLNKRDERIEKVNQEIETNVSKENGAGAYKEHQELSPRIGEAQHKTPLKDGILSSVETPKKALQLDKRDKPSIKTIARNPGDTKKEKRNVTICEKDQPVENDVKNVQETRPNIIEKNPKTSAQLKARSNLQQRTNSHSAMILVDQRISEVQRRINRMVKPNPNVTPVA